MITKQSLIERIDNLIVTLKGIDLSASADPGIAKKELVDAVRKCGTGYGTIEDNLGGNVKAIRSLLDDCKAIKRTEFETVDKFLASLSDFRDQFIENLSPLQAALAELPDEVASESTGGGSRQKFEATVMVNDKETVVTIKDAHSFYDSEELKSVATGGAKLAEVLRNYLQNTLGWKWNVGERGGDVVFYKFYRLMRPSIMKRIAAIRAGK